MIWRLRMLRGLCAYLLIALAGPAVAHQEALFTDFYAAADQLDRLAGAASSAGTTPPRISDPEIAALFARLTDARNIFDRTYRTEDLPELAQVLTRAGGFLRLYVAWGEAGGLSEAVRTNRDNRNTVLYQNELIPVFNFLFDATTQIVRTASSGTATIPADRREDIVVVRNGLTQMLNGMLGLITLPGISPDHRLAVTLTLDRNAGDLAAAMSLSQRGAMASRLEVIRTRVGPQGRAAIDHALRAFNSPGCAGLCAI